MNILNYGNITTSFASTIGKKRIMSNKNTETEKFVTIAMLMDKYSASRSTVIKWVKEDPQIRYFKDDKMIRVHLQDFEDMISRKIEETRED